MNKIQTIFDRNWEGDKRVVDKAAHGLSLEVLAFDRNYKATEKVDGMNVRLTIRSGEVVRMEKRRNPDKFQKGKGIVEPWYTDVDEYGPQDKYLVDAIRSRKYTEIPDGEWSGEAYGEDIQGNPLAIKGRTVMLFSCGEAPVYENVPTDFAGLKAWLSSAKSKINPDSLIEGIVWHRYGTKEMFKIKRKDF
jgi:hypothetical protein